MVWLLFVVLATAVASVGIPLLRRSYVVGALVLANLGLFLLTFFLFLVLPEAAPYPFPSAFLDAQGLLLDADALRELRLHALLTAMYLHGGFLHITGNVLILYLLGLPLEDRIGGPALAALYLLTGVVGSLTFAFVHWTDGAAGLGASGAILGLAGAFLALYPRERIFFLVGPIISPRTPVYVAVGVVIAYQFVLVILGVEGVGVSAHVGGLTAGILLAPLFKRREPTSRGAPALELADLATDEDLREILDTVEGESVAEVREAWLDHFLERARCPRCGGPLQRAGRRVTSDCGWERRLSGA